MKSVTVRIPDSLSKKIEELGNEGGFSVEQFLASAASEKLSVMLQENFLDPEALRGSRKVFERVLAAVPDVPPIHPDDEIK